MTDQRPVSADVVSALAATARLALQPERAEQLAPQLAAWLTAANELNAKMSEPSHRTLLPATIFTHPEAEGATE